MKNEVLENGRVVVLVLATVFITISLLLTNQMAEALHHKEKHDVELWAAAMERVNRDAMGDYINDPPNGSNLYWTNSDLETMVYSS